jgi:hypothetical protein
MRPRLVFAFWLGSLDSRVAAGRRNVGGTHDIRFCAVGGALREFIGTDPDSGGYWTIPLEAYPEAGLERYELTIAEYGGRRGGECALPAQYGGSGREYGLWRTVVRPFQGEQAPVQDCVLLIKDLDGRYHARVVRRERLPELPGPIRNILSEYDQCGRLIRLPPSLQLELMDLPLAGQNVGGSPFAAVPAEESPASRLARIKRIEGKGGKERAGQRYRRSRQLAEELKRLYEFHCQLCDGTIERIPMGGDRYYVEVYHMLGLSEAEVSGEAPTQEGCNLNLDSYKNVIVVCPHHHMMLHHGHGGFVFDRARKLFVSKIGSVTLPLRRDRHLADG